MGRALADRTAAAQAASESDRGINRREKSPNSISINSSLVIHQIKKERILLLVPTDWGCLQFRKGHIHGLYRKLTPRRSMEGIALVNWQLLIFAKELGDVKKYRKWHLDVPTLNRTLGHQIAREISQK